MLKPAVLNLENQPAETLRQWLSERPFEWGPALATRAAFRVLPWAINYSSPNWIDQYTLPIFHALFIAWSTCTRPIKGHKLSAELSANLLYPAAMFYESEAYFASGMRHIVSAISSKYKINRIDHSVRSLIALNNLLEARGGLSISKDLFWKSVENDVAIISMGHAERNNNTRRLMLSKIVSEDFLAEWNNSFSNALDRLRSENDFEVWRNWIQRVIGGSKLNFLDGKDGDTDLRDRLVSSSIIQELDAAFWSRSAADVDRSISDWIASAGLLSEPDVGAQVPPQNQNAISFQANSAGQIELTGLRHYDALRGDEDTQDRYNECVALAQEVSRLCEGSNAAGRLGVLLKNYIDSAGQDISSLRPSLFVQRGERLRQELSAYQGHDTLLPPIADDILLDLRAWQAAHNMLVGLDPALMARDLAISGPDNRIANVPPQEIHDIAIDADKSGILASEVVDIVIEAANLAPATPDPTNRRTVWTFETGRNLVIEAFNLALRHPKESTMGAVVSGAALTTFGVGGVVVSLAAGSIPAAKFLLRHREWIETRLGDSPTWQALFLSLCGWIENNTPLKNE